MELQLLATWNYETFDPQALKTRPVYNKTYFWFWLQLYSLSEVSTRIIFIYFWWNKSLSIYPLYLVKLKPAARSSLKFLILIIYLNDTTMDINWKVFCPKIENKPLYFCLLIISLFFIW